MANQLASNPWIIDTPSNTVLFQGRMPHVQVEYVGYAAAGVAEIQDRNGRTVAILTAATDLRTVRSGRIGWVEGLKVPTTTTAGPANLPSGKLILYYE